MSKQREALLMAFEWIEAQPEPRMIMGAETMRAIREALAEPEQKPLRRGDRLKCMESGEYCIVWATSRSGKTMIQWADRSFGEYTEEQIGEHFWIVPDVEQEPVAWMLMNDTHCHIMASDWKPESDGWKTLPLYTSPAGFTPLADEAIHQLFKHLPSENRDGWVVAFARAIEKAHGIGDP